jgi:hypothetical protein
MNKKEYRKQYYIKNKDKINSKNKKWALNNPQAIKNTLKKYNQTPKGIYHIIKTNCHNKKRPFTLKMEDFIIWYNSQNKKCHYCEVLEKELPESFRKVSVSRNGTINRLTIDRKNNNIGYIITNLVLACAQCNRMKGEFLSYEEMLQVGSIIKNKWKNEKINTQATSIKRRKNNEESKS